MKKYILVVFVALATLSVSAQKFGIKAGVNFADYYGDDAKGLDSKTGFQVGALYEMPLGTNLYLQPEAVLTLKGAKTSGDLTINPYYLEIPVRALYKIPAGPGSVTIAAGPYISMGLFGKSKNGGDSYNLFTKEDGEDEAALKRFDMGLSAAVGYELQNGLFFNLESGTGLLEVAKDTKMKNSVFTISAGFKF